MKSEERHSASAPAWRRQAVGARAYALVLREMHGKQMRNTRAVYASASAQRRQAAARRFYARLGSNEEKSAQQARYNVAA